MSAESKIEITSKQPEYAIRGYKTSAHGINFQLKMLMFVLNSARSSKCKFKLATEMDDAGKFDDIILDYEDEGGQTKTLLIQCKHKADENNAITLEALLKPKSDYCLEKYMDSYINIKKNQTFAEKSIKWVILCTNIDILDGLKADQKLVTEIGRDDIPGILQFTGFEKKNKKTPTFYKMNIRSSVLYKECSNVSKSEIQTFEEKFILAVNLPNEKEMDKIIEEEMGKNFCIVNSKVIVDKLYSYIHRWMSDNKIELISESEAAEFFESLKTEIREMGIEGVIFNNDEKMLEFGDFFENTGNLKRMLSRSSLWLKSKSPSLTIIKIAQLLRNTENYVVLSLETLLTLKDKVMLTFKSRSNFSIYVECLQLKDHEIDAAKKLLRELLECVEKFDERKTIVLVSNENNDFIKSFARDHNLKSAEDRSRLKDITQGARERILDYCIKFQGCDIMLRDVLNWNYEEILDDQILSRFVERDAVNVGTTMQLTKEIENVYINRSLEKESFETKLEPKICVIKGGPGIGKSTELTNMAFRKNIENKNTFVIKINLLDHTVQFDKNKKFDKDATVNCLLKSGKIETDFGRRLLEHHLFHTGQMIIYLDGYDEVGSAYEESVISFIKFLNDETKVGKIWITTRPHSASALQRELVPAFYRLLPFDKSHRKEFLQKYWNYTLNANDGREHIEKYVDDLLKGFENSNIENFEKLIGVPLQMKMIAELHEDNCKAYWETKGHYKMEFISMNVYNLFQEFIEKKFEIYFKQKAKMDKAIPLMKRLIEQDSKQKQKEFQEMAVRLIFPNDFGLLIKCTNEDNPIGLLDVGIVEERNDGAAFIHRTFAEYYAAECLAEKLSKDNQNKELISLLKSNYFGDDQQMLRYFLDNMLAKDLELHKAAIYDDVDLAKRLINENELLLLEKDAMGRIALHLSCTYSIFSFSSDYLLLFPVDNVLELLISVDCKGTKPMQITTRDILDYTPYFYAAISTDTDRTLALLAWHYCDYHFTNYLDLNEIEMQFKNLQGINGSHYYGSNVTVPNISHSPRNSSMVVLCQNNANFKAIKAYFYGSVENTKVCKENGCIVLKSALQSYFTDIFLLKMNDPKYLIEIVEELSKLRTTEKLFMEAIQTKDYAFLLGFTLACPQNAFDLWMYTDCLAFLKEYPKRTNEELELHIEISKKCQQEEIFSDNKLKNILVLAIRGLLMNHGVNVLSSINFIAYFKKIVADDYISFEASLRLMNYEDRSKIHAAVQNGFIDAIAVAISEINPCKLYNIAWYGGYTYARFDFKLYCDVSDYINTNEQAAIAYVKHCLEKKLFIGITALLEYPTYLFLDSSWEVQDVLHFNKGFTFQGALGEVVQKNLEHTLDHYLSARSRGYPLSATQHIISQTAWLYGNGIPPFIQLYFEENFKHYNFVDEVCRVVKCGKVKDLLRYFIIAEEKQIEDLLEANENEIFKHFAQFKSENDASEKNVSNELNDSKLFMSDEFVNDIRTTDEFGVCVVNALTRRSPHQISFLNLFFKNKTGEAVLRGDADYFDLLKNALTYMNHRLVERLFYNPTFNYQGKCFNWSDDLNRCMAMIFKDNISVFNRLVKKSNLKQRKKYLGFTRFRHA